MGTVALILFFGERNYGEVWIFHFRRFGIRFALSLHSLELFWRPFSPIFSDWFSGPHRLSIPLCSNRLLSIICQRLLVKAQAEKLRTGHITLLWNFLHVTKAKKSPIGINAHLEKTALVNFNSGKTETLDRPFFLKKKKSDNISIA